MGLADRDYMRARARRTAARENAPIIKPRTLIIIIALIVAAAVVVAYLA